MWRFVSAARMAQIKADARAEGYIKAVREGLAANDAAKDLRSVTRDNTQTANTAVQEMKSAIADKPKQVTALRSRRRHFKSPRGSYADPNLQVIANGAIVEDYIFKNIGKLTQVEMAKNIVKNMGTHVKGSVVPIKVIDKFVCNVLHRRIVWDADSNTFVNVYSRKRPR